MMRNDVHHWQTHISSTTQLHISPLANTKLLTQTHISPQMHCTGKVCKPNDEK